MGNNKIEFIYQTKSMGLHLFLHLVFFTRNLSIFSVKTLKEFFFDSFRNVLDSLE